MSFSDKLDEQFRTLSIKAPSHAKHLEHLYADFIELIALVSNDCYVTVGEIMDRLQDEGVVSVDDTDNEGIIGSTASEQNDKIEIWVQDLFRIIQERAYLFGLHYPFEFRNNKLTLKQDLDYKNKLYLILLICSNLNLFTKIKSELTSEFEVIAYFVLINYLPSHAIVKQFGKNSDYAGNAKTKIRNLACDLKVEPDEYELSNISDYNSQERGLDIIGWIPFGDTCANILTILAQCACGKDWYLKHHDTKRYISYLKFYKLKPYHALFIPYSLINHSQNRFYRSDDVEEQTLLFERKRILEFFNNEESFNSLNSKLAIEKCIDYQEDIV